MRYEAQPHLVIANIDIRVVIRRFGKLGYTINEGHCLNEVIETPVADQLFAVKLPSGMGLKE
jgi:hypothetical protein